MTWQDRRPANCADDASTEASRTSKSATEENLRSQTVATSKVFASRDGNSPRPNRPVIAAGDMTDFGRAAHNMDATGVATLAARAHEGMAAAASAGLSAHKTYASE